MLINLSVYISENNFKRFHFDTEKINEVRMNRALQRLNLADSLTADLLNKELPVEKGYTPSAQRCWTYRHKKSLTVSETKYDDEKGIFVRGKIVGVPQMFD